MSLQLKRQSPVCPHAAQRLCQSNMHSKQWLPHKKQCIKNPLGFGQSFQNMLTSFQLVFHLVIVPSSKMLRIFQLLLILLLLLVHAPQIAIKLSGLNCLLSLSLRPAWPCLFFHSQHPVHAFKSKLFDKYVCLHA